MRLSIKVAVLGQDLSWVLSQKRYLGLFTIALAIATLFCIPPEISDGSLL
jgi:membrane protein YqaA with SNARE-associated domain